LLLQTKTQLHTKQTYTYKQEISKGRRGTYAQTQTHTKTHAKFTHYHTHKHIHTHTHSHAFIHTPAKGEGAVQKLGHKAHAHTHIHTHARTHTPAKGEGAVQKLGPKTAVTRFAITAIKRPVYVVGYIHIHM